MDDTLPPRQPIDRPSGPGKARRQGRRAQPKRIGQYRVESKLGEGGMGTVYRCWDEDLSRAVALKVLHEKFAVDEHYRTRFRREAQTVASLSHACVAQIHGIGEETHQPGHTVYIVMEYLEGKPIETCLRESGAFPLEEALRVARDTAAGLREALRQGIVHRDIKPSNLLITNTGDVKILDFGLAKELRSKSETLTQEGVVLGTPDYISPEQGRGREVDHRTDIYSLGATLYHMLTGKPPFERKDQVAVIVAHVNDLPIPAIDIDPTVPRDVSDLVDRMLAKDADQRYADYDELIADLEAVALGEEPPALADARLVTASASSSIARPTISEQTAHDRRQSTRRTMFAAVVGALLAVAVIGLVQNLPSQGPPVAAALGSWFRPLDAFRGVLDLDFSREPPSTADRSLRDNLIRLKSTANLGNTVEPPRTKSEALRWENYESQFALAPLFEEIEEIQLGIGTTSGRFHLALTIADPLSFEHRSLMFRVRPKDGAIPIQALRHNVEVVPQIQQSGEGATLPPVPRLGSGPFKLFFNFKTLATSTRIEIRITGKTQGKDLYHVACELAGTDWTTGTILLETPSAIKPFSVGLERLVVQGRIREVTRAEEPPWRSSS
jgi:serine/threonine protein kinase